MDTQTRARLPSGKLSRVERGALEHARTLICSLASIVFTDITCLRVAVPKTSFFRCLHLSSIRVSRSFPHRLADVRISVSTSFIRCYGVARGVPEDCGGRGMRRP